MEGEQVQQVTAVFYKVLNNLVSRRASPQVTAVRKRQKIILFGGDFWDYSGIE